MQFPDTQICQNAEQANYENYLVWQARTNERRRQSLTQFNMFQSKAHERMYSQQQFKEDISHNVESNKDAVERRLNMACACESCCRTKDRSNSDSGLSASSRSLGDLCSPTTSRRSMDGLSTRSSTSPPEITITDGRNRLSGDDMAINTPPRSRHHQRRKCHARE